MVLRRSQRGISKLEELLPTLLTVKGHDLKVVSGKPAAESDHDERPSLCTPQAKVTPCRRQQRPPNAHSCPRRIHSGPFRFLELPQEIRDEIYSYLIVRQTSNSPPILDAMTILKNRKKRLAARKTRERLNQQRLLDGKRPTCPHTTQTDPILHVDLLRTSHKLADEAIDCMYTKNWFAISLDKLPLPTFEVPLGWDLSRIKRLQIEIQLKDSIRMNRYVDWSTVLSCFPLLQFLHVVPTLHPRYYEWAKPEFTNWSATPFVHKGFFRELLAAVPGHVHLKLGLSADTNGDMQMQGKKAIESRFLWDMYMDLGSRVDGTGRPLAVNRVVC